jgi:hypothetical protein
MVTIASAIRRGWVFDADELRKVAGQLRAVIGENGRSRRDRMRAAETLALVEMRLASV